MTVQSTQNPESGEEGTLMGDSRSHLVLLLQAEYIALKQEQTNRIVVRENGLYTNLLAVIALTTIAFAQTPPRLLLLLAIPICACVVLSVYINNDLVISQLRLFFATEFPSRCAELLGKGNKLDDGFLNVVGTWESFHRSPESKRRHRKLWNTTILCTSFLGPPILGVLAALPDALDAGGWVLGLCAVDLLLIPIMGAMIIRNSDI